MDISERLDLGPKPWIVGHRGAAGSALENSLAAIQAGVDEGAAMLEIDVQLTSDHEPVVFHDWDLRRLGGRSEIVERTSLDQLLGIDLVSPFDEERQPIARLEKALDRIPARLPINLEIKRRFHQSAAFESVLRPVVALDRPLLVSSFDWNLLVALRHAFADLPLAPLGRFKGDALAEIAESVGAASIHAHRELAPQLLEGRPDSRVPILAYTVDEPDEARQLIELGAAGVFTDSPGRMRDALARHA